MTTTAALLPEAHRLVGLTSGATLRVHEAHEDELTLSTSDEAGLPAVGEQTTLCWSSWRGLHEALVVRRPDLHGLVRLVLVAPPSSLQRRRFARVAAAVPVRLLLADGTRVDAVSLDLSEGGLQLVLPHPTALPDELAVELPAVPTTQAARVVRQDEQGRAALAFVPPVPAARALRSDVLARQARARLLEA